MKNNLAKVTILATALFILCVGGAAQTPLEPAPELSVAGFRLGDETAAKKILQNYSPRYDNELAQPKYFFYNKYGTQVLSVTAHSKDHRFLIVAIEAFAVGESYQNKHFQLNDVASFTSESGFFIGEKASATSLIFAVPNITRPSDIIKKKGVPTADEKAEKARTLRYRFEAVKGLNAAEKSVNFGTYTAQYRFVKNRLRRFSIAVETNAPKNL